MSPATTLLKTGRAQSAPKPRMTSGTAKPDSFTERPNNVSDGTLLCIWITAANANGPATQAASTKTVLIWLESVRHSTPTIEQTPQNLTRAPQTQARASVLLETSTKCSDRRTRGW